jgi:hypothetical protein
MKTALFSAKFWLALLASLVFGLGVTVKAAGNPNLTISSPTSKQQVIGNSVTVKLAVSNFNLTDYKTHSRAVTGQGHVHLWLDQTNPTPASAVKVFTDSYTFENVKPGSHVLIAELVNNNHTSLVPPVTNKIEFTTSLVSPSQKLIMTPFMVCVFAFLFLAVVLYFVTTQTVKFGPKSGKSHQKSSSKSSKRRR